MTTKDKEYWRSKGEQDRAQHKDYNPPHGFLRSAITWTIAGIKKVREDNEAYHNGWNYSRNENAKG
jgi:hypothetical protein